MIKKCRNFQLVLSNCFSLSHGICYGFQKHCFCSDGINLYHNFIMSNTQCFKSNLRSILKRQFRI